MMNVKKYFVIVLIFLSGSIMAQDIHFSQTATSPFNLNPALSGNAQTNNRFILNHKSQWNSFTNAYKTISSSFDHRFTLSNKYINSIGVGILINSDRAGDGNFGNTGVFIPVAVHKYLFSKVLMVSFGLQAGFNQTSVDYSKLSYGSQFNGNVYDSDLPTYENFAFESKTNFDLSTGINFRLNFSKVKINTGISIYHITNSNISFGDNSISLPQRKAGYVSIEYFVTDIFQLLPALYVQQQGKYNELVYGMYLQMQMESIMFQHFLVGVFTRDSDAIIFKTAFDMKDMRIGISYDFNISDLTNASNGKGGFEVSLIYLFNTGLVKYSYPPRPCPDYI